MLCREDQGLRWDRQVSAGREQRAADTRKVSQCPPRVLSTHQLPAELPMTALLLLLWVCWVWSRMRCAPTLSLASRKGFGQGCAEQPPRNTVKQGWRSLILKTSMISPALAGGLHASAHISVAQDCSVMFTCAMKWLTPAQS